jgi:hypothetical protein
MTNLSISRTPTSVVPAASGQTKKRIAFYNGFGTFNAKSAQDALNSADLQKPFKKGGSMMEGRAGDPGGIVLKPDIQN